MRIRPILVPSRPYYRAAQGRNSPREFTPIRARLANTSPITSGTRAGAAPLASSSNRTSVAFIDPSHFLAVASIAVTNTTVIGRAQKCIKLPQGWIDSVHVFIKGCNWARKGYIGDEKPAHRPSYSRFNPVKDPR